MQDQESYVNSITECDGENCTLKDLCRRYTTIVDDFVLYGDRLYDEQNDRCDLFWRKD